MFSQAMAQLSRSQKLFWSPGTRAPRICARGQTGKWVKWFPLTGARSITGASLIQIWKETPQRLNKISSAGGAQIADKRTNLPVCHQTLPHCGLNMSRFNNTSNNYNSNSQLQQQNGFMANSNPILLRQLNTPPSTCRCFFPNGQSKWPKCACNQRNQLPSNGSSFGFGCDKENQDPRGQHPHHHWK